MSKNIERQVSSSAQSSFCDKFIQTTSFMLSILFETIRMEVLHFVKLSFYLRWESVKFSTESLMGRQTLNPTTKQQAMNSMDAVKPK